MKTIKIAPDLDEITIDDEKIHTDWNGGITYKADLSAIRNAYKDDWLKSQFQQAIALVSKPVRKFLAVRCFTQNLRL